MESPELRVVPSEARDLGVCLRWQYGWRQQKPGSLALLGMTIYKLLLAVRSGSHRRAICVLWAVLPRISGSLLSLVQSGGCIRKIVGSGLGLRTEPAHVGQASRRVASDGDQLCRDRNRDLLRGDGADVEPDGGVDAVEQV